MHPRWEAILRGEHSIALAHRAGRRVFGLMPSPWRCKFCNAPFKGPYAGAVKRVGYTPSRKNPHICARCIERAPEGGAIVPLAVLFGDVRGYTAMCQQLSAAEAATLVQQFYEAASAALLSQEALLGQITGDEVMALFVPGLAGRHYLRKAVEAARSLLRAVRYAETSIGPLDLGIGVASGEEYVGNVGGGGYKDFTAIGDVTNMASRLTATARNGQIFIDAPTYAAVALAYPDAESQELALKGREEAVEAFRIPP